MVASFLSIQSFIFILCHCSEIEPWTTNATGEYYLFHSRPTDITIRNLTCHTDICIIQCNEEESCQKFQMHGSTATNINLECNYPEMKELRPGSCWRANIFSQSAKNIAIYCTNENCAETKFFLNDSNHSSITFDGDWAGKFAVIYGHNIANDLFVTCNDTESCSDISIHCPANSQCSVHCNGTKSCLNAHIYVGNDDNFNQLSLDCDSFSTACTDLSIICLDGSSNSFWFDIIDRKWRCVDASVCCPFEYSQNVIVCEENSECAIDCDIQSCHWSVIDAEKAKSLNLYCRNEDQCKYSNVYCPNGDASNCNIECGGKQSCKFMNVSSQRLGSLKIACTSRSGCQLMNVNVGIYGNVNIVCENEWACANSKFYIFENGEVRDKSLNVLCDGRYSCEGIEVYCPYKDEHSCLLQCSDDDSSCGGVHIFGVEGYEYDYLDIVCPKTSKAMLKACNFMKISCEGKDRSTVLRFDEDKAKCSNDDCCPWKQMKETKKKKKVKMKKKFKKKETKERIEEGKYDTIIAITCCLITMYLLTTMCSMTNNLK